MTRPCPVCSVPAYRRELHVCPLCGAACDLAEVDRLAREWLAREVDRRVRERLNRDRETDPQAGDPVTDTRYKIERAQIGSGYVARFDGKLIAVSMTKAGCKQAIAAHKRKATA